jgi:hypothetical protein
MIFMAVLALAVCPPFVNVKSLPSWQMVKATFFWTSRYEAQSFASALRALGRLLFLSNSSIMVLAVMATESP